MPRPLLLLVLAALLGGCSSNGNSPSSSALGPAAPTPSAASSGLPLPGQLSRSAYQTQLYAFLGSFQYRKMAWKRDKTIRDTGPYKNGKYYGTHPAVRVYYSPEVMTWLGGGRQGQIPDGAMIIKEMYPPPAVRYAGAVEQTLPTQWTVMVRDHSQTVDGWYWAYYDSNPGNNNPPVPQAPDNDSFPFRYPDSGFGSYCVRCHSSAAEQMTFSSTDNIEGFPGVPLQYEVDDSWKSPPPVSSRQTHPNRQYLAQSLSDSSFVNQGWLALYPQFPAGGRSDIASFPGPDAGRVPADGKRQFMTSDQCMSCHSGDNTNFGPNLVSQGVDVSPWGEWQWSMMGLAGRDPIFHAQLDSELVLHTQGTGDFTNEQVQNLCLHCHGVMGQRQYVLDHPGDLFTREKAALPENSVYQGLALDGISCAVCHQSQSAVNVPVQQIQTGDFTVAPRQNGLLTAFGPFPNPLQRPMADSLAMSPQEGDHMTSSTLCASCHTVYLPVLDAQNHVIDHKYEQATYLEWVNSSFRDGGAQAQSCQQCHMPGGFAGAPLDQVKLANIQDQDFPITTDLAPLSEITVNRRQGYRRHMLQSINLYALEFFRNFPDILGVRTTSFMTGYHTGLPQAINNALDGALNRSASLQLLSATRAGSQLTGQLKVTNLVGHRLPSGVGFRRLFLEFLVLDAQGQVVWGSGRTNALGVIVDQGGQPLLSEFQQIDPQTGKQAFQPHYQTVTAQNQAQIYEELDQDGSGNFTTSFLSRVTSAKDNRLLPQGWTPQGPAGFDPAFAEATSPHGGAASDPDFLDGTGSDTITYQATLPSGAVGPFTVKATVYSQSIPPRYLQDRFNTSQAPATRRLHYLGAHLDDSQTNFPGWKLLLSQDSRSVP